MSDKIPYINKWSPPENFVQTVKELRADGYSWEKVGTYFGVCSSTIRKALEQAGANRADFTLPQCRGRLPSYRGQTLCWKCANAVPCKRDGTGCSWSKRFIPVEGWTAEQAWLGLCNKDGKVTDTYTVHACPQFVKG